MIRSIAALIRRCVMTIVWAAAAQAQTGEPLGRPSPAISRHPGLSISARARPCRRCACTTSRWASRSTDAAGRITNAVMVLHGTGGTGGAVPPRRNSPASSTDRASRWISANTTSSCPTRSGTAEILQAQRRPARALPALRLRRHDRGGLSTAERGARTCDHLRLLMGTSMGCMHSLHAGRGASAASWTP